jgi:hypothetical protein
MSTPIQPVDSIAANPANPETPQTPLPRTRAEINRANAQHSTGPRTPEGKAKSRLNSTTHGLTAQVNALIENEDPAAFEQFRAAMFGELAPAGPLESALADTIVAQHWRLRRIPALEANLLTHSTNPVADLAKLSLHEQRLTRLLNQNCAALQQLQAARRAAEHEQMVQAAALRKLYKDHNRPFHPADFGFVFSLDEIDRYTARCLDLGAAKIHAQNNAQAFLYPEYRPHSVLFPAPSAA